MSTKRTTPTANNAKKEIITKEDFIESIMNIQKYSRMLNRLLEHHYAFFMDNMTANDLKRFKAMYGSSVNDLFDIRKFIDF